MHNIYFPETLKIITVRELSHTVKMLRLEAISSFHKNDRGLFFVPGQYVMAGNIGFGEAPFGILSSPYEDHFFELAIRKAGTVTSHLHVLAEGDTMTCRGPYGNGFPLNFMEGRDIVIATGGCGIPPVFSLIEYIVRNKSMFGKIFLLYGAKTPEELLLPERLHKWQREGIGVLMTVDKPSSTWKGHTGFVTDLLDEISVNEADFIAVICGPEPMMHAFEETIRPFGISDKRIFVSMERRLKCGVGKCQHCTTGNSYVCMDGPVFTYDKIKENWD